MVKSKVNGFDLDLFGCFSVLEFHHSFNCRLIGFDDTLSNAFECRLLGQLQLLNDFTFDCCTEAVLLTVSIKKKTTMQNNMSSIPKRKTLCAVCEYACR